MSSSSSHAPEPSPDAPAGPSRTGVIVTIAIALTIVVITALSLRDAGGRSLDDEEDFLDAGQHALEFGDVTLTGELTGDWIARPRCDRWVQLNDATNDANTIHLVHLDAVPSRGDGTDQVDIVMEETPTDVVAWLAQRSILLEDTTSLEVDGHPATAGHLVAGDGIVANDAIMACGDLPGVAGTGMLGPQAGFDQYLVVIETPGVPVLVIGAAWVGGDIEASGAAVRALLDGASLDVAG